MKICKDCKWSRDLGGTVRHPSALWVCGNEAAGSDIDPVDGERRYKRCDIARVHHAACGPEGNLWEEKKW